MRRLCQRVLAVATVAAFVAGLGLPFLSPQHAWVNDPDSGWAGPVVAGPAGTCVETADAHPAPEHCATCHWMRALGSSVVGASPARPARTETAAGRIEPPSFVVDRAPESGPARAPPSFLA